MNDELGTELLEELRRVNRNLEWIGTSIAAVADNTQSLVGLAVLADE